MRIVIKGINPEPWAIGTINCYGKGKGSMSPNPKVVNYQQAIKEELDGMDRVFDFPPGWPLDIKFYYARSTERGQPADVTNLNKATEDALQGIAFGNDRHNRRVMGEILVQGPDVKDVGIIIVIRPYEGDPDDIEDMLEELHVEPVAAFQDSTYQPPDEDYL